ncbi:MAG: hypothetical protein Q8Q02_05255, partial [Nocardioides sp.]|nr:hypothetical protein [Nocardioides sp.]
KWLPNTRVGFRDAWLPAVGAAAIFEMATVAFVEFLRNFPATLDLYGALATLRRTHPALRRGGLRWLAVEDDALAFVREHPDGDVLVAAWRDAARLDLDRPVGAPALVTGEVAENRLEASGPALAVWRV